MCIINIFAWCQWTEFQSHTNHINSYLRYSIFWDHVTYFVVIKLTIYHGDALYNVENKCNTRDGIVFIQIIHIPSHRIIKST